MGILSTLFNIMIDNIFVNDEVNVKDNIFVNDEVNVKDDNWVKLQGRDRNSSLPDFSSPNYNPFRDGGLNISLSPRTGYGLYDLVGMFYYLNENNYGRFNGYAVAEVDNNNDKYAIAIYEESGKQIGYLPKSKSKERQNFFNYILNEGSKVHAYGYVQIGFNGKFYGAVCVENDKTKIKNRNKPYIPNECDKIRFDNTMYQAQLHNFIFYSLKTKLSLLTFPKEWVGKKFSMLGSISPYTQKEICEWFKANGAFFVGTVSSKVDYLLDFDPSTNNEWGETKQRKLAIKYNTYLIKPKYFFEKVKGEYEIQTYTSNY